MSLVRRRVIWLHQGLDGHNAIDAKQSSEREVSTSKQQALAHLMIPMIPCIGNDRLKGSKLFIGHLKGPQ
jgi:hypothetical protein